MKKTPEQIWEEFQKELEENDKKVSKEIYIKSDKEKAKEYAMFVKKNKCKVIGGGKNGTNSR